MKKVVLMLLLVGMVSQVQAVSFGISNPDFNFRNMQRMGEAEKTVLLSTDSEETIQGKIEISGEASSWISFNPAQMQFSLKKGSPYQLAIKVNVPKDTPNGNYTASIRFIASEEFEKVGNENLVKTAIAATIRIEVNGQQKVSCKVISSELTSTEEGLPFSASVEIHNNGTIRINPLIEISADNIPFTFSREIAAGKTEKVEAIIPHSLNVGSYTANIAVPDCSHYSVLAFEIFEKGSLDGSGEIVSFEHKDEAELKEWLPFSSTFANTGKNVVKAKLIVDIYSDGKLVSTVETNDVFISGGTTRPLVAYFVPSKPGNYQTVARVAYNDKISSYKRDSFVVKEKQANAAIYLGIVVAIGLLLMLIMRKKTERVGRNQNYL